jgi:hypothetical protein
MLRNATFQGNRPFQTDCCFFQLSTVRSELWNFLQDRPERPAGDCQQSHNFDPSFLFGFDAASRPIRPATVQRHWPAVRLILCADDDADRVAKIGMR